MHVPKRARSSTDSRHAYGSPPNGTVIREYCWNQQNRLLPELHGTHESMHVDALFGRGGPLDAYA